MKSQCLPFSQISHTTRLFIDFLSYSPGVQPFYPHSPYFSQWMKEEASQVKYDPERRKQVSAILERQNKAWNASPKTLENLNRLRNGSFAVVTGQQVGLFGGPMFSIYKALSAVKLAEDATAAGIDAVPVFWLATYDHDLAEVNHVSIPNSDGTLRELTTSSQSIPGAPVSEVKLGDEILPVLDEASALLGDSEATQMLRDSYRPGESLGTAFARFYTQLFASWGVIVLDASDPELHRVAMPIYREAAERASEIDEALIARGKALQAAGYHQQVKVTASSVLLFALQDGVRTSIQLRTSPPGDQFVIPRSGEPDVLSTAELVERIEKHSESFSPNVLLRPVVQDFLLPTLAYAGGAAEVAYFSQAGAVYEKILGRVTPIVPRFSATLVEPKALRWLKQYDIGAPDVMKGPESLSRALAARSMPSDLQAAFEKADRSVQHSFAALRHDLAKLDATLVGASETAAEKIHYQINRLRERALAAALKRSEVIQRHAESLNNALYPGTSLQERGVAGAYFVAKYGPELLQTLHDAMRSDCLDHQILEL